MAATSQNSPIRYRIKDLVLDAGTRRVMRGGETLKMGALTFDLLKVLADSAPALVTYNQLAERVWQGRPVTPETIAQRAKLLRDALSEDARSPRYFELIRGQGYRLLAGVEALSANTSSARPKRRATAMVIATAAAVVAIALLVTGTLLRNDEAPPSVAVLPFADLSEHADQQYLADGIAEELIQQLSSLDGLEVASRTESFFYKGPTDDLRSIGEKLGVSAILEGSVRKSDDEIRVAVQLIEVDSGFHLWSANFDRELVDIFAIQEDIAASVAGALGVKLGVGGVNEFRGAGTRNFEAYEAYLRDDFERATELDPNYAAAWARRGLYTASTMWVNSPEGAPAIIERAHAQVSRAIQLDPASARANTDFATLIYATMDWQRAEQAYDTALSLRRDDSSLGNYANMMMRAGRSRYALRLHEEGESMLRIPPLPFFLRINPHFALGQLSVAREKAEGLDEPQRSVALLRVALNGGDDDGIRAAIATMPKGHAAYLELYAPLMEVFDSREASLQFLRELANDPDRKWPSKYESIALFAAYFDDPQLSFDVFSRELKHTTIRFGTLWYPVMSDVRKLPEFKTFVTDVNLVEYWRTHGWSDFCRPQGVGDFICE
ncbi:MAG: winged helix-turn-helix domain-containing protein [Woeseiaceae bacterium]